MSILCKCIISRYAYNESNCSSESTLYSRIYARLSYMYSICMMEHEWYPVYFPKRFQFELYTLRWLTQSEVGDLLYDLDSLQLVRGVLHGDTAGDHYTNDSNKVAISFSVTYSHLTVLNPLTGSWCRRSNNRDNTMGLEFTYWRIKHLTVRRSCNRGRAIAVDMLQSGWMTDTQ